MRVLIIILFLVMPGAASAAALGPLLASAASAIGLSGTATSILLNLAASFVLSAVSRALQKKPSVPDLVRDLEQPSSLPPYRFAYGHTRLYGSPAPWRVKGNILYGFLILNSRPSEGNFTVYFDKRKVEVSGDAYDFSGAGAAATNAPFSGYVKYWIGLGNQTTPPEDITDEVPEFFDTTDGWQGLTVIWLRLDVGPNGTRQERWPRTPPEVEVEGDWSLVWDPRDGAQSLANPATWTFSDNQALCALDALTQNPLRAYRAANLHLPSFEDAADIADEAVALKAGGTEARYRVSGVLIFSTDEIEDQLEPLMQAGAARFTRVSGRLGIVPGAYVAPSITLSDALGDGIEYTALKRGRDLPTQMRVSYVSAARDYESAELEPWDIPGALAADGVESVLTVDLSMVTSPTQGMRVRKILGYRARRQKALRQLAPPEVFDLLAGATATVALPAPRDVFNGVYEVASTHPGIAPVGDEQGVALRCPIELHETSAAAFAWDPATEEEDIVVESFDPAGNPVGAPGAISVVTGVSNDLDTGGTMIPRIKFSFAPSASASVTGYEWEYKIDSGPYQPGGTISTDIDDGAGNLFAYLFSSGPTVTHKIRVRAMAGTQASDWVESSNIIIGMDLTAITATAAPGRVEIEATTPNLSEFGGVRIFRNTVNDYGTATDVSGLIAYAPNATNTFIAGDASATDVVVNGDFASATGWTTPGGWSIAGGVASHVADGANNVLSRTATLEAAANYRTTVTVLNHTAGGGFLRLIGATNVNGTTRSADGTYQEILTAPASPTQVGYLAGTATTYDIDDLRIVKDTAACLPMGAAYFWIVPETKTGTLGQAFGPYLLTIY